MREIVEWIAIGVVVVVLLAFVGALRKVLDETDRGGMR